MGAPKAVCPTPLLRPDTLTDEGLRRHPESDAWHESNRFNAQPDGQSRDGGFSARRVGEDGEVKHGRQRPKQRLQTSRNTQR
jgi:hypothetical protein